MENSTVTVLQWKHSLSRFGEINSQEQLEHLVRHPETGYCHSQAPSGSIVLVDKDNISYMVAYDKREKVIRTHVPHNINHLRWPVQNVHLA